MPPSLHCCIKFHSHAELRAYVAFTAQLPGTVNLSCDISNNVRVTDAMNQCMKELSELKGLYLFSMRMIALVGC